MLLEERKIQRRIFSIVAIQVLGLLIVGLLTIFKMVGTHDLNIYYRSSLYLLEGKLPYRDFNLEYPPFALLPFVLPRMVALGLAKNYYIYAFLFLLENILFSTINMLFLVRVVSVYASQRQTIRVLVFYTLFALIISPVLLWRYDLFPTVLTVVALVAVLSNRPTLAGISLGLGVAAKLYPLVLLPVFTVYFFTNKSYRAILNIWLGTLGTVFLSFLPFLITTKDKLFSFLDYHKERGLQIESLPAGIISLVHKWGLIEVKTVAGYGSRNIVSPLDDIVLAVLPLLLIIVYISMLVSCWYRFREERYKNELMKVDSLVAYTLLALLIFIVTNKVFSPQYIVWLIPFAALLKPRHAILMLAICITTYIMASFGSFRQLDYVKILWLNLRNFLILGFSIWIFLDYLPSSTNSVLRRNNAN
ncbi:glycosyltransferase 87 family protein [Scytonema sp. PCC 10023]|uniref:glycosyltransferase 87 family protein n=1 Tax=Scytonema sp. PCC 10023 TaxID=1680591 RepID=UPI0039C5DA63